MTTTVDKMLRETVVKMKETAKLVTSFFARNYPLYFCTQRRW